MTPDTPLCRLPLLTAGERRVLLHELNEGHAVAASGDRLLAAFEAAAASVPERIALVFGEPNQPLSQRSYACLNHRSSVLAGHLQTRSVGPGSLVGLALPRSLDWLVAMLAVLKTGGAFMPVDPELPPNRLKLLADCADLLLGSPGLEVPTTTPRLCPNELQKQPAPALIEQSPAVDGDHLAYVIFTSGSTGTPKGVAISRHSLSHYIASAGQRLALGDCGSMAMVSTLAADLGNTMLFPALWHGATLHLISDACATSPQLFGRYLHSHRIEALKITPSHLAALMTQQAPAHGSQGPVDVMDQSAFAPVPTKGAEDFQIA